MEGLVITKLGIDERVQFQKLEERGWHFRQGQDEPRGVEEDSECVWTMDWDSAGST